MFEVSAFAVPEKVPLELNVIPVGSVPDNFEKVILSPSTSVAVTVVKFEDALLLSAKVPSVPLATPNVGILSTLINPDVDSPVLPDAEVNLTLYG